MASGPDGDRVYTLKGADEAYRLMVQNMAEGALTIAPDGLILFSNGKFASMLAIPHERVIGSSFHDFIDPEDAELFSGLLTHELGVGEKCEVRLKAPGGVLVPVSLSVNRLVLDGVDCFCVIVADLTCLSVVQPGPVSWRHWVRPQTPPPDPSAEFCRGFVVNNSGDGHKVLSQPAFSYA